MRKLLILSALFAAPALAGPFGVQGVELGKPLAQTDEPEGVSCFMSHCHGVISVLTFGGVLDVYANPETDAVGDIFLEVTATKFELLRDALIAKYGKPTTVTGLHKQNSFGAQVQSRIVAWEAADGSTMVLDEFGSLQESKLTIREKQEPRKSAGI